MEDRTLKDIINIKIDGESITCLIMHSGNVFVEKKIEKFLNANYDMGTVMHLHTVEIQGINVFPLKGIINHLRSRILKELAADGIIHKINRAIDERDNPKERELSEFDRMMLKAVNYNPKERENQI
ncbi:MAG: hypothetical protein FWD60_09295 [Candidatus Azobacteroides sp.]|nr:hypothetical protein [Candidatus Azobacteroides sp.]